MTGGDGANRAAGGKGGGLETSIIEAFAKFGISLDAATFAYDAAPIIEAVAELATKLNDVFADVAAPPGIENDRERYAIALHGVATFFSRLQAPFAARFFELGSAIGDLNSGTVHPLVAPSIVTNRRPDSSQRSRARALIVLGFRALRRSGKSRNMAASEIASEIERKYPSLKELAGARAGILSRTVINWHKEFTAHRVKNWEASELFAMGAAAIESIDSRTDELSKFAAAQLVAAVRICGVFSPHS